MTNSDFPNNLGIKCNKEEAYKFVEWYKANKLRFIFNENNNTLENPWHFDQTKNGFIYYHIGNCLTYSNIKISNYEYITFKEFAIKYKQVAIKGKINNTEYNKKIINYLESIGGINYFNFNDIISDPAYYFINNNNYIECMDGNKYIKFTLEELMEETKEVRIEIPEGYEIDESRSTFTNIVFKSIKLTYDKIAEKLFKDNKTYYINNEGRIDSSSSAAFQFAEPNNCTSKQQAEKLLAINKLMNVAKYLNESWTPNLSDYSESKYFIYIESNKIEISSYVSTNKSFVYFKSKELTEQAIKILGEEIIRLALSTDW